jgi:hypothetical protein
VREGEKEEEQTNNAQKRPFLSKRCLPFCLFGTLYARTPITRFLGLVGRIGEKEEKQTNITITNRHAGSYAEQSGIGGEDAATNTLNNNPTLPGVIPCCFVWDSFCANSNNTFSQGILVRMRNSLELVGRAGRERREEEEEQTNNMTNQHFKNLHFFHFFHFLQSIIPFCSFCANSNNTFSQGI